MTITSPPNYCTIHLARHGETEGNIADQLQGQTNTSLTPNGQTQAKKLGASLKHIHFSAIYSSDLGRAHDTAKLATLDRNLAITTSILLRERHMGRIEGRLWSELRLELKELLLQREQLSLQDRFRFKFFPESESDEDIVTRLITFLREMSVSHLGHNILVVSHGGIMRAFLIHLGYATYGELPGGSIGNTAYIKLHCDGTDFFIDDTHGITKKVVTTST